MDTLTVTICLVLYGLFALWLLAREGLFSPLRDGEAGRRRPDPAPVLAAVLLLAAALGARAAVLGYETLDYQNFLTKWVGYYRANGGFRALARSIGNYNIPYLYFLALFSYSGVRDLYLIKLLSVFFDIVLAWAAMGLLGRFTRNRGCRLALFFAVLFLPTVYLNGSLWGQCDSIYTALLVLGIWLALDDRPALSMICAAVAFGFKLQAVFVLPVYAVLWMRGKFKLRHFLLFPLSYVLLVLPAVLLGRPFVETLTLYAGQTGSIGDGLNYNSPSVFALFRQVQNQRLAADLGIIAAFAFMLALLEICLFCRSRLNDRAVLGAALLFAIGIPFLLPHMHERYFFAADILSLVLAFADARFAAVAVLAQFASLLGYHAYLKMRYLLLMEHGARALILALLLCAAFFALSLRGKEGPAEPPAP